MSVELQINHGPLFEERNNLLEISLSSNNLFDVSAMAYWSRTIIRKHNNLPEISLSGNNLFDISAIAD